MKEPEKAPETEEPAKEPETPEKPAEEPKPVEAPAKTSEVKSDVKAEPPANREMLDAIVEEHGIDAAIDALKKVKVVDLRSLAREYNGEFGIAGREIRNANKTILIEEFRKFFTK
ncbi:MAG: hypothetical protein IJ070_04225 [Firmicutes bacterium]|nr:hypothetical protein [Bacillota bacterium]MBQ9708615.1 hypothetical protein [Bacillota bacterium]